MSSILISENDREYILGLYGIIREDFKRPFEKLLECKFTTDGKYVIFEGQAYSCLTGEKVPINEEWTLSDILHTGADILSIGMDFVIPGSGAVVDVLNAVSYIIEGQFKGEKERDSLYLMAVITFGFVLLPGPLQAIATPLKRAIKTGAGMTSKVVIDGLKIIGGSLDTLLVGIPSQVNSALKSPLAKNIMGKWANKISGFITNFTNRIKQLLSKLSPKTKNKSYPQNTSLSIISKQKSSLLKLGYKLLDPNNLPKTFYHGTSSKIDVSNLTTTFLGKNIRKGHKTGSTGGNGMYFSENLWDNLSQMNFTNPLYKTTGKSVGSESAEKYAQLAIKDGKKGYIYKMSLSPNAIVVPESSLKGINVSRINDEQEKKLLSLGVDAIYRPDNEIVIVNSRAIQSFDLGYVADKFIGKKEKNYFGDLVPSRGSLGFNWKKIN